MNKGQSEENENCLFCTSADNWQLLQLACQCGLTAVRCNPDKVYSVDYWTVSLSGRGREIAGRQKDCGIFLVQQIELELQLKIQSVPRSKHYLCCENQSVNVV